jgi:hypothetical protein
MGPVRAELWDKQWVPFARDAAGDLLCVDQNPAPGGIVGQVAYVLFGESSRRVVSTSLSNWLLTLVTEMETGRVWEEQGRLVRDDVTEPGRRPKATSDRAKALIRFLLDKEQLALVRGHRADELVPTVRAALSTSTDPSWRAHRLSELLIEHPAVDELYASEEDLSLYLQGW